ncbi:MAG: transposase [Gammaproteobacteria bacterium]|nr:transposase [Gammaproteobacteria bacterium]
MARLVAPGFPHHVTQRGNRRHRVFFSDQDFRFYLRLVHEARDRADIDIWAYCLMPNHVHFVVVPHNERSLVNFFSEAHRRYSRAINQRFEWRGHLWQERFHSSVLDEKHLLAAVRYVELNPVRANLCRKAEEWQWSSVHAHIRGSDDDIVSVSPMRLLVPDWMGYLDTLDEEREATIRASTKTGRPCGDEALMARVEEITGRDPRPARRGPKPSPDG